MTAIKSVELPFGVAIENAIHRIEFVSVEYKNKVTYTVRVYADLKKPATPIEYLGELEYKGGDVLEECYEHLMSLGGYAKA